MIKILIICLPAFSLLGCSGGGGGSGESQKTFSGYEYVTLAQGTLAQTAESMSGEGKIAFKNPIGEVSSEKNFQLSFELTDKAYVELLAYGDEQLKNAVQIRVTRNGDLLQLTASAGDKDPVSRDLTGITAASAIGLSIDVHNSETPTHVLAWNSDEKAPTDDNALFNSDADGEIPGNGTGMFWGIALGGAKVTSLTIDSARLAD